MKIDYGETSYWESLFQTEPPQPIKKKEEEKQKQRKTDFYIAPIQPEDLEF